MRAGTRGATETERERWTTVWTDPWRAARPCASTVSAARPSRCSGWPGPWSARVASSARRFCPATAPAPRTGTAPASTTGPGPWSVSTTGWPGWRSGFSSAGCPWAGCWPCTWAVVRRPAAIAALAAPVFLYRFYPLEMSDWRLPFLPLLRRVRPLWPTAPGGAESRRIAPWQGYEGVIGRGALAGVMDGMRRVRARLGAVTAPLLAVHCPHDATVPLSSSMTIVAGVPPGAAPGASAHCRAGHQPPPADHSPRHPGPGGAAGAGVLRLRAGACARRRRGALSAGAVGGAP